MTEAARASSPGRPGAAAKVAERERQLVIFQLAREVYGLDINWVRAIITLQDVTRVPGAPAFVEGVINLRGHVIPVVDLRKRFGLEAPVDPRRTRIVVVDVPPHTIGLVVDAVTEVLRIRESVVEPAGNVLAGIDVAFIQGVAKLERRLIILLDLQRLLHAAEIKALEQVETSMEVGELGGAGEASGDETGQAETSAAEAAEGYGADPESARDR
ncbi:MAG: chemotaxis protein CheW [Firmicutes bacterium]|nr:chemotaxis protein CheW [Bacillota bacterium]